MENYALDRLGSPAARTCTPGGRCRTISISPNSQGIGYTVYVVKPRSNESNLQDRLVIKTCGMELFVVLAADFGGIFRELYHVVEHDPVLLGNGSSAIVFLERVDQGFVQCHTTQKLCVGLDSIVAPVRD